MMVGDLRGSTDLVNLSTCEAKNRHNDFSATDDGTDSSGWHSVPMGVISKTNMMKINLTVIKLLAEQLTILCC